MTAGPTPEQRAKDGRLAWIIVSICALLSLTLVVVVVTGASRYAPTWAGEMMREQREQRDRETAARYGATGPIVTLPTAKPLGDPASWISSSDYPVGALRRGEEGRTRVAVTVDESGNPTGCVPFVASTSSSLDMGTCHIFLDKARFEPADAGQTGARTWVSPTIRWELPDTGNPRGQARGGSTTDVAGERRSWRNLGERYSNR